MRLDDNGQPVDGFLNRKRRTERDISELLGLTKGILADGIINDREVEFLTSWGSNHPDALAQWPTMLIFARLRQMLQDGHVDDTERTELQELLAALVGGTASLLLGYEGATTLPLDTPPPLVCYGADEVFVFTGKFAYGPRNKCEEEVAERQSRCEPNVTRRTNLPRRRHVRERGLGTHLLRAQDSQSSRAQKQWLPRQNHRRGPLGEHVGFGRVKNPKRPKP